MHTITREILTNKLESHKQEMIGHIRRLIAIESIAGRKAESDTALDYVLRLGAKLGMATGVTAQHDCGYVEIGQGREVVGILTHVDVVDPGDLKKWPFSPFECVLTGDGMLHGRGIVDDKGPVIMCLYILLSILELGIPLDKRIRLIIGTTEEGCIWHDMEHYIAQFGKPDFGFSPDGDFPVYYSEKGYCDLQLLFPEDGRLARIEEASAGEAPNTIPGTAVWKLCDAPRRDYTGIAFHSSMPQCGENALLKMAWDASRGGFDFGRFLCDVFTDEHAPGLGLDDGNDTYGGIFVDRTVAAPTVLRRTEQGIVLTANVRVRYGISRAEIESAFNRLAEKYHYTYTVCSYSAPMLVDYRMPFIQKMNEVYESYGYKGDYLVASGASYAAAFPNSLCWGPILPGDLSCAHMEDERLPVASMMTACQIYMEYLLEMCAYESEVER